MSVFFNKLQGNVVMLLILPGKQRKGNKKQLSNTKDLFISLVFLFHFLDSMEIFSSIRP